MKDEIQNLCDRWFEIRKQLDFDLGEWSMHLPPRPGIVTTVIDGFGELSGCPNTMRRMWDTYSRLWEQYRDQITELESIGERLSTIHFNLSAKNDQLSIQIDQLNMETLYPHASTSGQVNALSHKLNDVLSLIELYERETMKEIELPNMWL
jgi:hypothetical protein